MLGTSYSQNRTFGVSGNKKDDDKKETFGTFDLEFDNKVGAQELTLADAASTDFKYTNSHNQNFNVSLLGYYITNIKLEGPNGEAFVDPVTTGAAAADVKGIYQVLEGSSASQTIRLANIPSGKYDKVTFTLGIPADIVQEGATGGVLDPAEGAWLWNWDAGYIGFAFEVAIFVNIFQRAKKVVGTVIRECLSVGTSIDKTVLC